MACNSMPKFGLAPLWRGKLNFGGESLDSLPKLARRHFGGESKLWRGIVQLWRGISDFDGEIKTLAGNFGGES